MKRLILVLSACMLMSCAKKTQNQAAMLIKSYQDVAVSDIGEECLIATKTKIAFPAPFHSPGTYSDLKTTGCIYTGTLKTISPSEFILVSGSSEAGISCENIIKVYIRKAAHGAKAAPFHALADEWH